MYEKVLDVYSQPGRWFHLKYYTILVLIILQRFIIRLLVELKIYKEYDARHLERMNTLSTDDLSTDAVFFHGVTDSGYYMCGGLEKRHHCKGNGLFYIAVPKHGLLENLEIPNTHLDLIPSSLLNFNQYAAAGMRFNMIKPMKMWHIQFEAPMKSQKDPNKQFDVKFCATFNSKNPFYYLERDISSKALASAIAHEDWSQAFFKNLKKYKQSRYEQIGTLHCTLAIDDEELVLDMKAYRDHSFAERIDWSVIHRYIYHVIHTNGKSIVVGVASQPVTLSRILVGFVSHRNHHITVIDECDLLLYQHGENGVPEKNLCFSFKSNGKTYDIETEDLYESVHYKGKNNEAQLFEKFLKCKVNGVEGRGIAEWHYNVASKK